MNCLILIVFVTMLACFGPAWGQTPDRIKGGGVEQPQGQTDKTPGTQPDSPKEESARENQELLLGKGENKDNNQIRNPLKRLLGKRGIKAKPSTSFRTSKNYFSLNEPPEDQALNTPWWNRLCRDSTPAGTPGSKWEPDNFMQKFSREKPLLQGGETGVLDQDNFIQEFYRERLAAEPEEEKKEELLKGWTKLFDKEHPDLMTENEDQDENESLPKKEKKLFDQGPPEIKLEEEGDQ